MLDILHQAVLFGMWWDGTDTIRQTTPPNPPPPHTPTAYRSLLVTIRRTDNKKGVLETIQAIYIAHLTPTQALPFRAFTVAGQYGHRISS